MKRQTIIYSLQFRQTRRMTVQVQLNCPHCCFNALVLRIRSQMQLFNSYKQYYTDLQENLYIFRTPFSQGRQNMDSTFTQVPTQRSYEVNQRCEPKKCGSLHIEKLNQSNRRHQCITIQPVSILLLEMLSKCHNTLLDYMSRVSRSTWTSYL